MKGPAWNKGLKVGPAWNSGKRQPQTTGSKHPNWKGGISKAYKIGYNSIEYKIWRKAVFERDDYICQGQTCQNKLPVKRGGRLTAHHIKSFAKHTLLRYEVSNGITLCELCHAEVDPYYHRLNNKRIKK